MRHLGDNANLAKQTNNLTESIVFLISQAGVAGPFVFVLMFGIWEQLVMNGMPAG